MRIIFLIIIAAGLIYPQNNRCKVDLTLLSAVVNSSENSQKEYLFNRPANVRVDREGNIYVTEYLGAEIRKYSSEGKYLTRLGRAGKGPGEFNAITSYDIEGNSIIVLGAATKVTEYNTGNNYVRTIDAANAYPIQQIWAYPGGRILAKKFKNTKDIENIFYLYDKNLEGIITSFGHPTILFDVKSPSYINDRSQLNVAVLDNGDIFVSKMYYDGKLYKFDSKNKWAHAIYGRTDFSYRKNIFISPILDTEMNNYNYLVTFQDPETQKPAGTVLKTMSFGLLNYKNEYLLNFIYQDLSRSSELDCEFGVEVFNIKGEFLGYSKLSNKPMPVTSKVFCIDGNNNLYMSGDRQFGNNLRVPTIEKYKLNLSIGK